MSDDGSVENLILPVPPDLPQSALVEAGNYLNARLKGRTLAQVRGEIETSRTAAQSELDVLTARLVSLGLAIWAGPVGAAQNLIVRGQSNLLEDVSAMADIERIKLLFDDLETKSDVIDLLTRAEGGDGVRNLHRFGKQAVFLVGLIDDRGALPRFRPANRRRAWRHRSDASGPRTRRANGRYTARVIARLLGGPSTLCYRGSAI